MEEGSESRWMERTGAGISFAGRIMSPYENPRRCFLGIMTRVYVEVSILGGDD